MILSIIGYTLGGLLVGGSIMYMLDKERVKSCVYDACWGSIRMYTKLKICFKKNYKPLLENTSSNTIEKETIPDTLLIHDVKTKKSQIKLLSEEITNDDLTTLNFYQQYKDGQVYFKRFNTVEDLEYVSKNDVLDEKHFLQIELEQDNMRLEIQEHLIHFNIENNQILDRDMLSFYLNKWYNIELAEEYILHIIDNNVKLFTLSPQQSILINNDTYNIII